eukprot:1003230-Pyramimonas_sp.AAC.1
MAVCAIFLSACTYFEIVDAPTAPQQITRIPGIGETVCTDIPLLKTLPPRNQMELMEAQKAVPGYCFSRVKWRS